MIAVPSAATLEAKGLGADAARSAAARFEALARSRPGAVTESREWHGWYVPGRVEVLGKHTDYGGGRSLLCAAERGFCVLGAARADGIVAITDVRRGSTAILDGSAQSAAPAWARYPLTVVRRLRENFPELSNGADILLDSDLPSAAGMSSSSALMIATLLPLVHAGDLDRTARWSANIRSIEDLAAYAATIENGSSFRALAGEQGVGTEGGSEDHTAILCSRPGELAQYAFCPTRHERSIAFPDDVVLAIGVSGVAATKTGNARDDYNRASRNAARVLSVWRTASGRDDPSLAAAIAAAPGGAAAVRAALGALDTPDQRLLDRLDQFVEESFVLVPAAGDALGRGDLAGFGAAVARSQELAERLLGNQIPETMALARLAREHGALAASAFGAGFGGSVWALVRRSSADTFLIQWQNAYAAAYPVAATRGAFFLTRPGPSVLRLGSPVS